MVFLLVGLPAFVALLVGTAWLSGRAARAVGSPRGRFGPALVGLIVMTAVGLGFAAVGSVVAGGLSPADFDDAVAVRSAAAQQLVVAALLSALQLALEFAVVRWTFRLSVGRTFAPFGTILGVGLVELAVAMAVVRPYLAEAFEIPTGAMSPTLSTGDRVVALKRAELRRWDVVVYHTGPRPDSPVFCKRLIGLPGERLVFDGGGGVTVNGVAVPVPPVLAGRCHATVSGRSAGMARYADGQEIRLGDHQVFFIGDNVDRSYDSRATGPSDVASVIGVIDLIYWPPTHVRALR